VAKVADKTRAIYMRAVNHFLGWCADEREDVALNDYTRLDDVVTDYIHYLYFESGSLSAASNCLHGLILLLPRAQPHMLLSRRALQGWQRKRPHTQWPPLPWPLAVAIAVQLARRRQLRFAVCTLLAFDCLLRISETAGVCGKDVAAAADPRLGGSVSHDVVIRLAVAKTGRNQSVIVDNPAIAALVVWLRSHTADDQPLLGASAARFREEFKKAAADLNLDPTFVPHSLRHGGASHMFAKHKHVEDIAGRGRWASTKSARHYIQSFRALAMLTKVPAALACSAEVAAVDLSAALTAAIESPQ
jgi:integrase